MAVGTPAFRDAERAEDITCGVEKKRAARR
jgi:hypothetical protein